MLATTNSSATSQNADDEKLPQVTATATKKTNCGLKTSTRLNAPAAVQTTSSAKMRPSSSLARNNSSSSLVSTNSTGATLSVCSLASSNQRTGQQQQLKPMSTIKKSSSSLSATSSTISNAATKTNLSFSGIRRPVNSAVRKPPAPPPQPPQVKTSIKTTTSALTANIRDKEAQIKLLIKERDERKYQAERMAREALEWREKFEASELERGHMTSEADDEVVELRRLAQEFEDENKALGAKLQHNEQALSDLQFKLDECECERAQLTRELEFKERELEELTTTTATASQPANQNTERAISKAKYEREIEELREQLRARDEQSMQLRSSLEMKKNELGNLQSHVVDLERKLKIESERSERHLKRIDEINLELKACEAKLEVKQEENEMQEKQLRQLRQELRQSEEKVESISLARKRDVELLHNKLAASRRGAGSVTPTAGAKATPTPQDEIVRLQMEIRDLKDQLIDREAELDCNKRDLELIKRKMETRTLEVDCNNQELARRCQDLLEQNRQSEDTIKQLLKSTTEHSASLMRATEELREANSKCVKLREEIKELERRLDSELARTGELTRENARLRDEHAESESAQVQALRAQIDSLNDQIGELCAQLDSQTQSLHKDREQLADQLNESELALDQLRQELATARQDARSQKLREQELAGAGERLRQELELKEKFIKTRQELIESLRSELDDCRESLLEYKLKLEQLRESSSLELEQTKSELKAQQLRAAELQAKAAASESTYKQSDQLEFDEMRQKHSEQMDELRARLVELETELESAQRSNENTSDLQDYESQIEFLNSLVVDMQRKCDDYKARLAQLETSDLLDQLLAVGAAAAATAAANNQTEQKARASTLKQRSINSNGETINNKQSFDSSTTLTRRERVVRIQDPLDELLQMEREQQQQQRKPTRHISGRPYCDICRIYDTHHTIYCPRVGEKLRLHDVEQVASNNNNNNNNDSNFTLNNNAGDQLTPQATLNQQRDPRAFASLRRPAQQRAYCHHCELFGHSLKSCEHNNSIRAL